MSHNCAQNTSSGPVALRSLFTSTSELSEVRKAPPHHEQLSDEPHTSPGPFLLTISISALISGCGFSVTGGSLGNSLRVSPGSVDFGDVTIGDLGNASVSLVNDGMAAVDVQQISVTGQTFSLADSVAFPIHLEVGASKSIALKFDPTTSNDFSGLLTVVGASAQPMATAALRGKGKGPLSASVSSLKFGNVALNTPMVMPVTLTSTSNSTFTINSASASGPGFSVVGGSFPLTMSPGQSVTLKVQFNPTVTGSASGLLTLMTTASRSGLPVVSLSGTGVNRELGASSESATGREYEQPRLRQRNREYGDNQDGHSHVLGHHRFDSERGVDQRRGFSIVSGSLPATLSPGQSTSLTVQFKPTTTGTLPVSSPSAATPPPAALQRWLSVALAQRQQRLKLRQ